MTLKTRHDPRKKLLFFFSGTGQFRYGVAEVFRHLLNGIDKTRYRPVLVITGTLDGPVEALSEAVEVVELHQDSLRKAFLPLVRAIRRIRPEVIVSAMEHPNALTVLARLVSGHRCKLVLTAHGVFSARMQYMWSPRQGRLLRTIVRRTYPRADHVVCVSEAVRQDFKEHVLPFKRSSVIHNPVLKEAELVPVDIEQKEPGLIVTCSRLVDFKKVDEAIRALTYLEPSFRLVVLGDGAQRRRLETLTGELGLSERVTFEGYVDDPFAWYRKAEIFVLPSMWEGFGNVLIESMACGCQVVANSTAQAPEEVLGWGKYGFLYAGGDPETLAAAIREAHANPKSAALIVEYAQTFTDRNAANEYDALFEALLERNQLDVPRAH